MRFSSEVTEFGTEGSQKKFFQRNEQISICEKFHFFHDQMDASIQPAFAQIIQQSERTLVGRRRN